MKDVVTAANAPRRILVTGFGPFPGAPDNPTLAMLEQLRQVGVAGAHLALAKLPVTFDGVRQALHVAAGAKPDAVLLLGLATKRRILSVETRAKNSAGQVVPDTAGHVPPTTVLVEDAPAIREATWPSRAVLAALRANGHGAELSCDAGDYVCNAALFHALGDTLAPMVGFLHVPRLDRDGREMAIDVLADAARIALKVMSEIEVNA